MKKFLDLRFVYLMQETNTWNQFLKRKDEKIGISNDDKRRLKEVDDTMKNRGLKLKFSFLVFFAEKNEKRLHRIFKNRKVYKVGVSGGTEFFDLKFRHIFFVWWYLFFVSFFQFGFLAVLIIFLTKQLQII